MTVFQLLSRAEKDGQVLGVVANPDSRAPETVDASDDMHPFLAGSDELVRLAYDLRRDGLYRVREIALVSRYLEPVDLDVSAPVAQLLQGLLESDSQWGSIEQFLWEEMSGLLVFSIELRNPETGSRLTLSQRGVVQTSPRHADQVAALFDGRKLG